MQRLFRLYRRAYSGLSPAVWLLAGVMLINRCGTMVLPFLTLYLTQHLGYSIGQAGFIMAVYGIGAFVGTFIGGKLTDRYGFYYVQLLSLLFAGAFLLVLQLVTSFWGLCASVFVFTLFGDTFRPANQAAVAYYAVPANRTRAFSFNRLAINLGWSVGGGLGGWLAGINYNLLFWADGLTCLAAGIVLAVFLPKPTTNASEQPITSQAKDAPTPMPPALSPWRDRLFLAFVACSALYLVTFMQLFTIVPLYFKEVLRLTEQTIGAMMALNGLLIVVIEMALVYTLEARGQSKIRLIFIGVMFTAVAYPLLTLTSLPGLSVALAYILLLTVSEMFAMPFIQSFTVDRATPSTRGQYLALYAMGGAFAQTTAPAFGSLMVTQFGYSAHWVALAGVALLSAAGFWLVGKQLGKHSVQMHFPMEMKG